MARASLRGMVRDQPACPLVPPCGDASHRSDLHVPACAHGCPKKWIKVKGKYVEAPPLPEDYYENRASGDAYDKLIRELDETK